MRGEARASLLSTELSRSLLLSTLASEGDEGQLALLAARRARASRAEPWGAEACRGAEEEGAAVARSPSVPAGACTGTLTCISWPPTSAVKELPGGRPGGTCTTQRVGRAAPPSAPPSDGGGASTINLAPCG